MSTFEDGTATSAMEASRSTLAFVGIGFGLLASLLWVGFLGWCLGWLAAQVVEWIW